MLDNIGNQADKNKASLDQAFADSDNRIDKALANAKGLQSAGGDAHSTISFDRIKQFGSEAIQSPVDAQEFSYRNQQNPAQFADLKQWEDDARSKSDWARGQIGSDPFHRSFPIPGSPQGLTTVNPRDADSNNFGQSLLTQYQNRLGQNVEGEKLYHAAENPGPIMQEYINQRTPPLPPWQQNLEEAVGRFAVNMIPVVNLLTDDIVPHSPYLSDDARAGIDIASGSLSGLAEFGALRAALRGAGKFLGESFGIRAPEANVGGIKTGGGEPGVNAGGAGAEVKTGGAGAEVKTGGAGAEVKTGGAGAEIKTGGAGAEVTGTGSGPSDPAGSGKPPADPLHSLDVLTHGEPPATPNGAGGAASIPPAGSPAAPTGGKFIVPDTYTATPKGTLRADTNAPGIYFDENGQRYIEQGGNNYPVRYDAGNNTWSVYNPQEPTKPGYAVKLEGDDWVQNDQTGGKGGAPGNRDKLGQALDKSPAVNSPGSYPSSVDAVNRTLMRGGVGLSNSSLARITENLDKVNAGTMTNAGATAQEMKTFFNDAINPNLTAKDRSTAAVGSLVNGLLSPAYHAQQDIANYHMNVNQSPEVRNAMHLFTMFDPHS